MLKNKNMYLVGKVCGSYRAQNLVKLLLDNKYNIYLDSGIDIYSKIIGKTFLIKVLIKIISLLEILFKMPIRIYMIIMSDIVFVLPMNNSSQLELKISKLLKKKIVVDYYISFYDTSVLDRKTVKEGTLKSKRLKKYDKNMIECASKVLFLNKKEGSRYSKLADLELKDFNYEIVPLCIDEKKAVKLPYFNKKNDYITICWWGTYIPLHGIEKIITAGKILKNKNINFKIYLFGNSDVKSEIYKKQIEELELKNEIIIINTYTFSNGKLGEFLKENCDVVLGNFGDSKKAKSVLVNKLVDGIALKAPVLNGESVAPNEFFDYKNDIWKAKNTPEDIAEKIIEISNLETIEIFRRIENSYKIYQEFFSEKAFKNKILSIIKNI